MPATLKSTLDPSCFHNYDRSAISSKKQINNCQDYLSDWTVVPMTFTCQRCGECCSTMGEIISIHEEIAPFTYRIWYSTTFEERVVTIDPDKRDLFLSGKPAMELPLACPFLRKRSASEVVCTVHQSRPELCRQYSCFRLLVLGTDGKKIGRFLEGTRYFTSTSPDILKIWDKEGANLNDLDDSEWEDAVDLIFSRNGYNVIR